MKRKTCIFKNVAMLFVVIGLFAVFVGCNDKNDEVGPLRQEVQTLRSDLTKSFDSKVDAKTKELQAQLDQAKKDIADLSKRKEGMSPEELQAKIDAATENLITVTAAQAMYEEYVKNVKDQLANAVTAEQLEALKADVEGLNSKVGNVSAGLDDLSTKYGTLNHKVALLETLVGDNKKAFDDALDALEKDLKAQFAGKFNEFTESLNSEVQKLNQKITTQRTDLEKMLKDYKKANDELVKANGKLSKANKTEIESLKGDVKKLKKDVEDLDEKLKKAQTDLKIDVIPAILNSRLTSIVFLPEYVHSYDHEPTIVFSPIETACDDTKINPLVEVKYMVNPSTVTAGDIDVNNLRFVYNDPTRISDKKSQAELVAPKAEFVSLKGGILTIRASLNAEKTWSGQNARHKIDQLMLQVPSAKGDFIVSSDWVRAISKPIRNYNLGKQNEDGTDRQLLPTTLADAKAGAPVVDLAYDETLDLNDFVKTLYGSQGVLNVKSYGLSYSYDLNDLDGNPIKYELGGNKTDQQQFIKLNGSKVTTRVYAIDGKNPASVDRTPIVHVVLKSNKCDNMEKEAFIKINIVRSKKDDIKPIEFTPEKDFVASCNSSELRIGTQEMNEKFYAKAELSKQEFHRAYTLEDKDTEGYGRVYQVRDLEDQESYNLLWTVSSADVWAALGTGKDAVNEAEISKVVAYRSGNSVIKVTFKATVKRPSVNLSSIKLANYWSADKQYARFNIAVPEKNSKDSNLAIIKLDIDNVFDNVEGTGGDIVIKGWDSQYDYNYTFVEKQSYTDIPSGVKNEVIKLYGDDNMLYAKRYNTETKVSGTPELVAEISTNNMIEYKQTTLAKYLLNIAPESMKVDLQMNVKDHCGHAIHSNVSNGENIFKVRFLRPINVDPVAAKNFVDGVDVGDKGSILKITDIVVLSDWRKNVANNKNFNFEPKNKNYYEYYGVKSITIDESNIKVKGLNGNTLTEKPASIKVKQEGAVDLTKQFFGNVTYRNNNATLNKAFELHIPVTVEYKWGEVKTTVKVDVKPTSDASRKRVK